MSAQHPNFLLIGGTTASGKSALALEAAKRLGGVIVNADSAQLYRDLPALTARPGPEDERAVPHELYGWLDADQESSVASWLNRATRIIRRVRNDGGIPIVVGGTGLYLKALREGLAPIPEVDPSVRAQVRALGDKKVSQLLEAKDPLAHSCLSPGDRQRRMRALEVLLSSGQPIGFWQSLPNQGAVRGSVLLNVLPPRPLVRQRIRERLTLMIEQGALDQLADLSKRLGDPRNLSIKKTLALDELCRHLDGDWSLEEALYRASIRTGHYAKRQEVWFRGQFQDACETSQLGAHPSSLEWISHALAQAAG